MFTFAVQRRANQLWLACCRAWASWEYPVNIMDIIWTHKTINIRYLLWIYCTNSLKRCTFQDELKSSRKGWDGWFGTEQQLFAFTGENEGTSTYLGLLINVQKLLNLQQNMYIRIINVVFDGVFFWNEYSNIRSEKPTSIRSLKNGIRASPMKILFEHKSWKPVCVLACFAKRRWKHQGIGSGYVGLIHTGQRTVLAI